MKRCRFLVILFSFILICSFSVSTYAKDKNKGIKLKYTTLSKKNQKVVKSLYKKVTKHKTGLWIAHRGYSAKAPENTEAAFLLAALTGANAIEADFRISKDGKLWIMHDPTVNRTTNGRGYVEDLTSKQLKKLKIDKGGNVKKFKKLRICPAETYFKICQVYKCIPVIELKIVNNLELRKSLVRQIYAYIKKYNFQNRCLIISFSIEMLKSFREVSKDIPIKLLDSLELTEVEREYFDNILGRGTISPAIQELYKKTPMDFPTKSHSF